MLFAKANQHTSEETFSQHAKLHYPSDTLES